MKYLVFFLAVVFMGYSCYSQEKDSCYAGVYLTQDDFVHNQLSSKINTGIKGNKVDFTIPSDMTLTVKIVTPDTTLKFEPGSIYGYNDCGKIARYYAGGKELDTQEDFYKLEEVGGLVIYSSLFISDK